jgi:hypothetical protein
MTDHLWLHLLREICFFLIQPTLVFLCFPYYFQAILKTSLHLKYWAPYRRRITFYTNFCRVYFISSFLRRTFQWLYHRIFKSWKSWVNLKYNYISRKLHGAAGIMAGWGYRTLTPYETSKSSRNGYLRYAEKNIPFNIYTAQYDNSSRCVLTC